MKKALSIILAFITVFASVAIGINGFPFSVADAAQQTYMEDNFFYKLSDGNAIITGYYKKNSTDEIIIPDTVDGYPVTQIAAEAFKGCMTTAITIPSSVKFIDAEAFAYDMPNIERYTVIENNDNYTSDEDGILYSSTAYGFNYLFAYPKNAPSETLTLDALMVGAYAFTDVRNLKTVNLIGSPIAARMYAVDNYSFYKAQSLETVNLSQNLTAIGDYAFADCPLLTTVNLNEPDVDWLGWDSFANTPFINNRDNYDEDGVLYIGNNLIATLPEADKTYYEIKSTTKSIAGGAFQWNSLKEVYIYSTVLQYMESNPFARCPNLEQFTLSSQLNFGTDEYGALYRGTALIAYPNGRYQTCYVVPSNIEKISAYAFYQSPIKNIYIPSTVDLGMGYLALGGDTVTDIHFAGDADKWESARHTKETYEKITAAENVANIHYNDYSTAKHQATLNNKKETVCTCGYTAEYTPADGSYTENDFVYDVVDGNAIIKAYLNKNSTGALVIPECFGVYPVTEIDCDFTGCMFTSVEIPESVIKIREGAFAYASNNKEFKVTGYNGVYDTVDGILVSVKDYAIFAYPANAPATEYNVPNSILIIMPYAFCGAKNLKTVNMPKNETGMSHIYTVSMIFDCAFMNSSVETVNIEGDDFFWMGNAAFKNSQLKEINFSFSRTHIGESDYYFPYTFGHEVFEGTPFLENAVYDEDGVFYHNNILISTTSGEGKNTYEIKEGTTAVAGGAFRWSDLVNVNIPASVRCVGGSAFSNAKALQAFSVNTSNEFYSTDGFGILYNKNKTKLVACPPAFDMVCYCVPRGVTEIGDFAFNNVHPLSCVYIPLSVTKIGEFSFGMGGFEYISDIRYEGTRDDWEAIEVSEGNTGWINCESSVKKTHETYEDKKHYTNVYLTQDPTCTEEGYYHFQCGTCLYVKRFPIPATGHQPEAEYKVTVEPTCSKSGKQTLSCSVCQKVLDTQKISKLEHEKELVEYLEPTCELDGGSLYKCKRCDDEIFEKEVDALGHISSGETVIIEATCTKDGGKYYLCERCGEPILDECLEFYPEKGHIEGEWKRTQEPTCSQKQIDTLFCAECNQAIAKKTGGYGTHNYRSSVITQTCTYKSTYYYCLSCGDNYYEDVSAFGDTILGENTFGLGHIVEEIVVEGTCTEKGKSYKQCTVCGETVGEVTESDSFGHSWSEETTKEATCSQEGTITKTCTVCGKTEEVAIPKIAHTFGSWEYESGNTFTGKCAVCNESFESLEVKLTFEQNSVSLYNKTSKILSVSVTDNISDNIVFTSSNSNIVAVYSNGKITAKAPGRAVITARIAGTEITAKCTVTVTARSFSIEWNVDGDIIDYSLIKEGDPIEAPEAPEIPGMVFLGWSPAVPETMPAENLVFTAVYNVISQSSEYDVSATYSPDAFSEPVSIEVKTVEGEREPGGIYMVDGQSYNQVGLYNIKAVNESSEIIQPNEGHKVTIRLAIPEAYKNRTSFVIYHRFDDGTREQLSTAKGTLRIEDGYLVFEVSNFSEFEIFVLSSSIKITNLPSKTVYSYGEEIDLSGITVIYTSADGSKKVLTKTNYLTVNGYDSTKVGKQTVTVRYGNYTDTFEVEVKFSFWQWILKILSLGFIVIR